MGPPVWETGSQAEGRERDALETPDWLQELGSAGTRRLLRPGGVKTDQGDAFSRQ